MRACFDLFLFRKSMKSDDKHDKVAGILRAAGVQRLNNSIEINIGSGFRKSFQIFPVPASISRVTT